ncbi:MAG TPA: FtsW/RodA/SpoVE family cell cycle protein [Candidatus Contendobacter sp.]|nr:FtsW/RodA/SpoVE family cell cycle protein [Candidatus Contendobacter sp.]HRZ51962.1 FtsW/RodA/SpoVE family cell cycle protein [Candidatus Contendobacter sp.]
MTFRRPFGLLLIWLLPVLAVGWTVYRAPAWQEPRALTVTLEPGRSLVLGREALRAPQADGEHVLLRREADGGWRLANIAPGKQVLWRPARGHDDRPTREWPLTTGARFAVGDQSFTVLAAGAERLTLQAADQRWDYDGLHLRRNGQPLPECVVNSRTWLRERLAAWRLGGLMPRPLRLGGGVYCADRLGLPGVPVDTALIAPTRPGFALRPGNAGRLDGLPVTVAVGTPAAESLWRRSIALATGDRLIIGRTHYRITRTEPVLELAVLTRAQRWPAGSVPPDAAPAVRTRWQAMAWLRPAALSDLFWPLLLGLPPLMLAFVWPGRRRRWPEEPVRRRIALGLGLAGAGLGLHVSILTAPALWPYLLAWPALLVWLWTVRSPWSAGLLATVTLLLGGGLATLLQLGVGAGESGWLRYGGSSAALAGAFGWAAWAGWTLWRWQQPDPWLNGRRARWGLRLLGGLGLALLAAQAAFGDEGGWARFQPFELTKLALITAAAYALMLRARLWGRDWSFAKPSLWLRYLGPVTLLLAVSGFALAFLRDFSPLVLLLIGALALAWAYLRAHPEPAWRWGGSAALLALILLLALGVAWLHDRPEDFPLSVQTDRIQVWAAPERYPHSGYQLRRALEAIRAGGWQGAAWGDGVNGRAMAIPVVENDFTPAFFLSRQGGAAALVLVGVQATFILVLLTIADRALDWIGRGDYRLTALGGFAYFTLYGGAALLGAHMLVSWGANLGFLPVMGQPMPFLSAAGSHLILFVLPIVALAVAVEENSHANPN